MSPQTFMFPLDGCHSQGPFPWRHNQNIKQSVTSTGNRTAEEATQTRTWMMESLHRREEERMTDGGGRGGGGGEGGEK